MADPTGADTLAAEVYGLAQLTHALLAARLGQGGAQAPERGQAHRELILIRAP